MEKVCEFGLAYNPGAVQIWRMFCKISKLGESESKTETFINNILIQFYLV